MTSHANVFIAALVELQANDRATLAELRRSLRAAPGTHLAAMPFVERFVARDGGSESYRQAMYLTAALYAANPRHRAGTPLAAAMAAQVLQRTPDEARKRTSSLEKRFLALLAADAEALPTHLRHAVQLLAADEASLDYVALLGDLARLLDAWRPERRDAVRERWARDFYRRLHAPATKAPHDNPLGEPK